MQHLRNASVTPMPCEDVKPVCLTRLRTSGAVQPDRSAESWSESCGRWLRHREIPDSVLDPKRDPSDSPRHDGLRSRSTQERQTDRDIKRPACVTKKTGKELP